jgi:acetyl-CoA acetyltransferase
MNDRRTAYIRGVGMHPFGRFPDVSLRQMTAVAVGAALDDAGLSPDQIEAAYFANSLGGVLNGQEAIRGEVNLHHAGISEIPIVNVENACASGSTALWNAIRLVWSGEVETALAVGAEKLFVGDTGRTLAALRMATDVEMTQGQALQFTAMYAMRLQEYVQSGLLTERHLAEITIKNQRNGALNPYAQFGADLTEEEVLAARRIAGPLTIPMIAGISDGAAAAVVSSTPHADASIAVRASILATGGVDGLNEGVVRRAISQAYESADIGPADLDVVEVHDTTAPIEFLYYEDLGLCARGKAGAYFDSGATQLGGATPVNPSGGLTARGHPVGATGLAQIAELVWQLRGQAGERQVHESRLALSQNSGGWLDGDTAVCSVHVLERGA